MESPHSVNSPRRILSLSKQRGATVFFPDDSTSGFGLSGERGPKPSEVYGFVGSITVVVASDEFSGDPFSWREMRSPLGPYLILALTKSMISCSIMQHETSSSGYLCIVIAEITV
ncbi:hypothetical protein L6164_023162 [Bauhinia variegata]|uniref:Uncharacterized protein n=1 Tax=Bauhinia variegata TaxID=167791 RepID=A0ACB9MIX4_BAUVA|nr:hypothetical protein L6164_023162 [Bauhinia variegata]